MLDKKLSWANRKIPRAPQPRLESGKNRSLLPIRRFRLAGCFHCSSFIAPVSPRRSQISRIRDNSTSLVESQLTTLRSCRSSRSLYYITLPSIHRRVFFTQQYIISVLFHGLILVYRNIYLPNQPVHILFISKERKKERKKKNGISLHPILFDFRDGIRSIRNRLLFFRSSSFLVRFSRSLIWPSRARLSFHFNAWSRTRSE